MLQTQLLHEVNQIFIDIFNDKTININEQTTTSDIEAWDSLNHIEMITAVEKHYKICFDLNDLFNFKDVGDLCNGIQNKLNKSN